MLPTMIFQLFTVFANLVIFIFIAYYLMQLRSKEKVIEKERTETDDKYHHVVDEALAKERKILEDAAFESSQIITGTKYVTSTSKEAVGQALQKMEGSFENEVETTQKQIIKMYADSLQRVSSQSLTEFQGVLKSMEADLQKQTAEFRSSLLPQLEKELDDYKKLRLQQADRTITHVIQTVAQEILNKSLSLDDHQRLLIESLEKAKKEGVFD